MGIKSESLEFEVTSTKVAYSKLAVFAYAVLASVPSFLPSLLAATLMVFSGAIDVVNPVEPDGAIQQELARRFV